MGKPTKPDLLLGDVLRPRLHRLVAEMWDCEDAARDFTDPEGVHQMRVASRRLRAALDAGEQVLTRKPERRLRADVRQLARALGAVRDGDVMIDALRALDGDGTPHPGIGRLITRLNRQREIDRARLLDLLDDLHTRGSRERSLHLFEGKAHGGGKIRRRDARHLVRRAHREVLARIATIPAADDIDGLHGLRIAAKRLRYALQLVEAPLAPESTGVLAPLAAIQDHLGDIHNADVLIVLIRDELHAILDERIDAAIAGSSSRLPGNDAVRDDLFGLLARTAGERQSRYEAFTQWWADLSSTGFQAHLVAIDASRAGQAKG